MQKIIIISLGKMKEDFYIKAQKEYEKRLSSLCDLKIIEIEPFKLLAEPNNSQIVKALDYEAEKILKNIPNRCYKIGMCIEGKQLDSVEMSKKLTDLSVLGDSTVCFIIGSSYGLSEKIKSICDLKLSMSKMTFPHKLARIMLLEQIYRGYKISSGGTYHK